MKVGEIASKTGVSRDAVRLYERMGLLVEVTQPHKWNNYKEYDPKNVKRINLIKSLKDFGFTLKECGKVFSLMNGEALDEDIKRQLIQTRIDQIESKMIELANTKKTLLKVLNKKDCTQHQLCDNAS